MDKSPNEFIRLHFNASRHLHKISISRIQCRCYIRQPRMISDVRQEIRSTITYDEDSNGFAEMVRSVFLSAKETKLLSGRSILPNINISLLQSSIKLKCLKRNMAIDSITCIRSQVSMFYRQVISATPEELSSKQLPAPRLEFYTTSITKNEDDLKLIIQNAISPTQD
jgi:hypothetical protein